MPDNPHFERHYAPFVAHVLRVIVLITAFMTRAFSLDSQGLWRDEVDQWRFALSPLADMLRHFTQAGWNGPMFSPVLRLWITGVGDSVYAMRYLSLLCGIISVSLVYVLSRRIFNITVAYWTASFCALSPYLVWYAQEVKMYTWVPMLILLALYSLERACKKPSWTWWLVTLVATCLAFYSHILAALAIPVLVIWFWLTPNRHPRAWVGGGVVFGFLTLPYLPLLIWQWQLLVTTRVTGYPVYTIGEMITALISGWTTGIYMGSWTGGPISQSITGLLCALAVLGLAGKNVLKSAKLVMWLVIPFLVIWFISLNSPMFTDRYLIWTAPAFYICVALGITRLAHFNRIWMWGLGLLVLMTMFPPLISQSRYPIKPQFNKAADYLLHHSTADELLLFQIPYNAHVFNYYTQNQIFHLADAPYTNWKLADGSYQVDEVYVNEQLSRIIKSFRSLWLVYSEVDLADERELVKHWLDTRWQLVDQQFFFGVNLYHYVNP